ncbi:DUF695 domain-containing protein [Pontibacter sp. G13]|uniref:DUF695 domain-containing protein n=1 Tax=Pontibacter sp. G13 TaxID=3074898 RepID=UPI00288BEF29|nr:DUF695 domain-containing protein [Pontibacter sp. G13]WNJ16508.1 DUF695 domain-containing protein [Pontibacter sp. G13]
MTPNSVQIDTDWDFYFCTIEDRPASIMLDLAIQPHAPLMDKSSLIQVTVTLRQPNEFGLTNQAEAEVLYVMEDQMAEHLSTYLGGMYVARCTSKGKRIFYFYCNSSVDYQRVVEEIMDGFPEYRHQVNAQVDANWTYYLDFLYPSAYEYQSILNRRVVDRLEQQGDNIHKAREVEHFLYFSSETDRKRFMDQIRERSFSVRSQAFAADSPSMPFSLMISRVDRVDTSSIDQIVLHLLQAAENCNGRYEGWGTTVTA